VGDEKEAGLGNRGRCGGRSGSGAQAHTEGEVEGKVDMLAAGAGDVDAAAAAMV